MVANNSGDTQAVIYYNNGGTWTLSKNDTSVVSPSTNFNRFRFATFLDYVFRVNGVQEVATSIDPLTPTWGTTNAPTTITPSLVAVFQDRVYVGRNGTGSASRVYFSSLPASGAITWDTSNDFFDLNPDDGDGLTAFENNGNRLLMWKARSMYRWNFGQTEPDRLIGVGTHSQECVKTNFDLGVTFFANEYGAYAYTGGRPKLISRKIQKWFDAIPATDLNDFAAEVDADHYYLYVSDSLTVDSKTYSNVMFVYTISLDAWTIYSLGTPVRFMAKLIQSSSEDLYFGSSDGRTYAWDSGTTDNETRIAGEILTKDHMASFPEFTKFQYIDVVNDNAFETTVSYRIDRNGDFTTSGNLTKRFSTLPHIGKEGRSIQVRLADAGLNQSQIELINIQHMENNKRK